MRKWFESCKTVEEIRKLYHDLAMKFHPDLGGDIRTMQDINSAYSDACKKATRSDKKFDWKKNYSSRSAWWQASDEMNEKIRQVIEKLVKLHGLEVELCGTWIWVGGNTKLVKEELKAMGLKWSHDKEKWYWVGYKTNTFRHYTMSEIRQFHGSIKFAQDEKEKSLALGEGV